MALKQAHQYLKEDNPVAAQRICEKLLADNSSDVDAIHCLAYSYVCQKQFEMAKKTLEKAIALSPENSIFQNHMGNTLQQCQEYDEAEEHYKHALTLSPDYLEAKQNLANLYLKQARYSQALELYSQVLEVQPDSVVVHYNLGVLFKRQEKLKEALMQFHNVETLAENYPGLFHALADCYYSQEAFPEASHYYKKSLQADKENVMAHNNLAACYLKEGEILPALEHYTEALKYSPDNAMLRENLASTFLQEGRYQEALYHYEYLIERNQESVDVLYNKAFTHMHMGELSKAISTYEAVLTLEPRHLGSLTNLAGCYNEVGDAVKARTCYQRAHDINADDPRITHMIAALDETATLDSATPGYVAALFDNYADYFEQHASAGLNYQVPMVLWTRLSELLGALSSEYRILDLGCGTGLMAEYFSPVAKRLVGVDVSKNMLAKAEEKCAYDTLIQQDIQTMLTECEEHFDIVAASDVFVYLGALDEVFKLVSKVMNESGWFAFTVEESEDNPYIVQATGRFCHSEIYIKTLAEMHSFSCHHNERVALRRHRGETLYGRLFLLQREV